MFHNFHFSQSDIVFGILDPFSGIFNAVSSEQQLSDSSSFLFDTH